MSVYTPPPITSLPSYEIVLLLLLFRLLLLRYHFSSNKVVVNDFKAYIIVIIINARLLHFRFALAPSHLIIHSNAINTQLLLLLLHCALLYFTTFMLSLSLSFFNPQVELLIHPSEKISALSFSIKSKLNFVLVVQS